MSNDAEHRAAFGLPPEPYPEKDYELKIHTRKWGNVKPGFLKEKLHEKIRQFNQSDKFYENEPEEVLPVIKKEFIKDNLRAAQAQNKMPCPNCAMQCEKTRDGYFQRTKYEYFKCYNCNKHFKITL